MAKLKYKINGESLFKYCRRKGILYLSVVYRMKKGQSIKEAVKLKPLGLKNKSHIYKGRMLTEICRENNIKYYTVLGRINYGESIEEALSTFELK